MINSIYKDIPNFVNSVGNLSLNDTEYSPGTIIKEKNNSIEYILLGYGPTRENLICTISSNNILNDNIYVINKKNIDKIIKINKLQSQTRFIFE